MKALLLVLLFAGCVKEMGDQPKVESFEGTPTAAPAGTIAVESSSLGPWPEKSTYEELKRGQQRYDIYCSVCHDRAGEGNGMVVQRGYSAPKSFYTPEQMKLSREHLYDVISAGFGRMPPLNDKLSEQDRRNVSMYVKTLQYSRSVK